MPLYDYVCRACDATWEDFQVIDNRHVPTKKKCPQCKKKKVELAIVSPAFGDALKLGITKLPDSWRDRLKEIKKSNHGSTIKTDR